MRTVAVTVMVALVLGAAGLVAWPFVDQWRSGQETVAAQQDLRGELDRQARSAPQAAAATPHIAAAADPGRALVELSIPRFDTPTKAWSWVAVEGTSLDQLALGPGHYTGTPLPGERGNVAFAAHRAGHGDPFIDFDQLQVGDEVRMTQGATTWTYELTTAPEIIPTSARWVLDPLPGRALTLTTCWPRYGSSKRMFVRGELVDVSTAGGARASEAAAQRP